MNTMMRSLEERKAMRDIEKEWGAWCMALYGNHDEHQCHKKPGHDRRQGRIRKNYSWGDTHECYCGVWW